MATSEEAKTYNILLLGETGCGKSTTINALANYLKFSTFEDAQQSEFIQLIPSCFTLPNPETGEAFLVESTLDNDNERPGDDGASKTQDPMGYTFQHENRNHLIRIIDTPGMGDTRGMDVDGNNFNKILSYLHHHRLMHGIVILIKSNETRRTASFRYVITQLLAHLHQSATANVFFLFTFGRNSFYGPGEGFATLSTFLEEELAHVPIQLEVGQNCFFIDNEAYRFLLAQKQGYPFSKYQETSFRESWNRSAEQTAELLKQICSLAPHQLQKTISLNTALKLIQELGEPMIQLQRTVYLNIEKIQEKEEMIKRSDITKSDILRQLDVQIDELKMVILSKPRTTCTGQRCIEVVQLNGQSKINFKSVCHEDCKLDSVQSNVIGHSKLQSCSSMKNGFCLVCGCFWSKHLHIACEYVPLRRSILVGNCVREVASIEETIEEVKRIIGEMKRLVDEYKQELTVIQLVAAKFTYLLRVNSNTLSNHFIEPYIASLLDQEKSISQLVPGYTSSNCTQLTQILDEHKQMIRNLELGISNGTIETVELEDIPLLLEELCNLSHCGQQFREMKEQFDPIMESSLKQFKEKIGLSLTSDNQ